MTEWYWCWINDFLPLPVGEGRGEASGRMLLPGGGYALPGLRFAAICRPVQAKRRRALPPIVIIL